MSDVAHFKVGLSADFLDGQRRVRFPDIGLSVLDSDPFISYDFLADYHPEYTAEQLQDYDVLISMRPRVTAKSLRKAERLCAIGRLGVGYDNVDVAACTERDIALYITPDGVRWSMAESIVLLVLALSHNLVLKDRMLRVGRWVDTEAMLGREPRGRTIGTVGLGNIASEAVRMLRGFGVTRVLAFDPYVSDAAVAALNVERVALEDLLRESDYVLVNCPLTPETRHMIGERQLGLMKRSAFLINTARGLVVEQTALIRALESRSIAGAALDTFENEPLENDSPLIRLDNVILTPHSVGWTEELFREMGRIDCEGAVAVSHGRPPACVVNREVLARPGFVKKLERYADHRNRRVGK